MPLIAGGTRTCETSTEKFRICRRCACQIVVADDFASRQHAKVEYREDKFILSDLSINGTYVRFGNAGEIDRLMERLGELRGNLSRA